MRFGGFEPASARVVRLGDAGATVLARPYGRRPSRRRFWSAAIGARPIRVATRRRGRRVLVGNPSATRKPSSPVSPELSRGRCGVGRFAVVGGLRGLIGAGAGGATAVEPPAYLVHEQMRIGELDRFQVRSRDDHAHAEPGQAVQPDRKIVRHADAAMRCRMADIFALMQRHARPGDALHEGHRRVAVDIGTVEDLLLDDAEHAERRRQAAARRWRPASPRCACRRCRGEASADRGK